MAPAKKRTRKVHGDETMDVSAAKAYTGKYCHELEHGNRRREKTRVSRRRLRNHGRCLREKLHGKSLAKEDAEEVSQKRARIKGPPQWHTAKKPSDRVHRKSHSQGTHGQCTAKASMEIIHANECTEYAPGENPVKRRTQKTSQKSPRKSHLEKSHKKERAHAKELTEKPMRKNTRKMSRQKSARKKRKRKSARRKSLQSSVRKNKRW